MDATEAGAQWQRWVVSGTADQLDRLLATMDANLPPGMRRLRDDEIGPNHHALERNPGRWYSIDPTTINPGAAMALSRRGGSDLRGGSIWFRRPTPDRWPAPEQAAEIWDRVNEFLDTVILPAAKGVGAGVTLPTAEEVFLSELPPDVQHRLAVFSHPATKSLPMKRAESEAWHEFVVAAFRYRAVIDPDAFARWLTADGWPGSLADELVTQFYDQCRLLTKYREEVVIA